MAEITPAVYNVNIRIGEDWSLTFDIDIDGAILNLTGATVYAQIRESRKRTSDLIIAMTTATAIGGTTGYLSDITLSLTDTQTSAIEISEGFYDVLVVDSSGNDSYYLEGKVTFVDSVTVKP